MNELTGDELKKIWEMVYNLSINFLHDEYLAEDATQEIFLKTNDKIGSFRKESSLSTWIYRIAYNYLVDEKRKKFKDEISFDMFEYDINNYVHFKNEINLTDKEMDIYVEQIKIGCTKALLQCLGEKDRFIFILGNIFDFNSKDGAYICNITETAYRQRLSRSTRKITNFMNLNCGLINDTATCHCKKRIGVALENERINSDMLLHYTESKKIKDYLNTMNDLDEIAKIYRDNPYHDKLDSISDEIINKIKLLAESTI